MVKVPPLESTPEITKAYCLDTSVMVALVLFKGTLRNNETESYFTLDFPQVSGFSLFVLQKLITLFHIQFS